MKNKRGRQDGCSLLYFKSGILNGYSTKKRRRQKNKNTSIASVLDKLIHNDSDLADPLFLTVHNLKDFKQYSYFNTIEWF
jgi:hypothetical protein